MTFVRDKDEYVLSCIGLRRSVVALRPPVSTEKDKGRAAYACDVQFALSKRSRAAADSGYSYI